MWERLMDFWCIVAHQRFYERQYSGPKSGLLARCSKCGRYQRWTY